MVLIGWQRVLFTIRISHLIIQSSLQKVLMVYHGHIVQFLLAVLVIFFSSGVGHAGLVFVDFHPQKNMRGAQMELIGQF